MADFIKGEVAIVYVWDGTSAYLPVACLTSNSLSTTVGVIETQTKCDPNVVIKGSGSFSYNLSLEGNYIDTTGTGGDSAKASHDYLLELQEAGLPITWKLDTGLTASNEAYFGTAIITDLEATFPSGDEFATFSSTFDGSGAIVRVDPNA
tara:strand:+ start:78 stop:527 length:450 start_codon:yes stop_codon:yes gene_type:complete